MGTPWWPTGRTAGSCEFIDCDLGGGCVQEFLGGRETGLDYKK